VDVACLGGAQTLGRLGSAENTRAHAETAPSSCLTGRIMGGLPSIAGTRIPVAMLVRMVAAGTPTQTILAEYRQLTEDDIREALRFAAASVDQRVVPLDQTA
jgi:uncharacterized protein (DUF433 family)